MLSRAVLVAVLTSGAAALAQADEFSAPPLIPVEGDAQPVPLGVPDQPPSKKQPYQQQPYQQQPYQQQPSQQQPYQQQPYQQQPYQQQPYQQQPYQQQPYQQQPYQQQPYQQQPYQQYPQQPVQERPYGVPQDQYQQYPQQPAPQQPPVASPPSTTKPFRFVGLLSGAVGLTADTSGFVGSARVEMDIHRVGLLFNYSNFLTTAFTLSQVHQFSAMGGWGLLSDDTVRLRVLGGLDVLSNGGLTALGPILGVNVRISFGRLGLDGAVFLTPLPFRQLELRAGVVLSLSIFEFHLGWRFQVVDATADGSFARLFSSSPVVNGPSAGVGLAF